MPATARLKASATIDDVAATLEREGYAIVERLLSPEEARAKRAELTRILDETPVGRNDFEGFKTRRIYALFAKTRAFDEPATHPLVLGVLDRVIGASYQLSAPVGIEISPGETAQVLHTDDGIYPIPRPHKDVIVNTMWPSTISLNLTARRASCRAAITGWISGRTMRAPSRWRRCRRGR